MNTKEQLRDQRNLMKTLKSNDYEGVKLMIQQKKVDLNANVDWKFCDCFSRLKMPGSQWATSFSDTNYTNSTKEANCAYGSGSVFSHTEFE